MLPYMFSTRNHRDVLKLPAVRRSGDRLTSSLNWLTNIMGWAVALTDSPNSTFELLTKYDYRSGMVVKNSLGRYRVAFAFEGDDSLLYVSHWSDSLKQHAAIFWRNFGMLMDLVVHDLDAPGAALFVGHQVGWEAGFARINAIIPDPKRSMQNAIFRAGDVTLTGSEQVAFFLARAYAWQDYPPMANYFRAYANGVALPVTASTTLSVGDRIWTGCDTCGELKAKVDEALSKDVTSVVNGRRLLYLAGVEIPAEDEITLQSYVCLSLHGPGAHASVPTCFL